MTEKGAIVLMYARSPELMSAEDTVLCVVDVQEKLLPAVLHPVRLQWNIRRLLDAADILQVPVVASEQYPQGLGPTAAPLRQRLGEPYEKLTFSCVASDDLRDRLQGLGRRHVLLAGMETHVCIQQTALDLVAEGYRVFLAVDATSARSDTDHRIALRRMESSGVTLTTTEATIFEWCFEAGTDAFRRIRALVTESEPVA